MARRRRKKIPMVMWALGALGVWYFFIRKPATPITTATSGALPPVNV